MLEDNVKYNFIIARSEHFDEWTVCEQDQFKTNKALNTDCSSGGPMIPVACLYDVTFKTAKEVQYVLFKNIKG